MIYALAYETPENSQNPGFLGASQSYKDKVRRR